MDYRIKETLTNDGRTADGVIVNQAGEWLGEYNTETGQVDHLTDDGGDYLLAPDNWRELIIEAR